MISEFVWKALAIVGAFLVFVGIILNWRGYIVVTTDIANYLRFITTMTVQILGKAKAKLIALVKELGGEVLTVSTDNQIAKKHGC